MKERAISSKVIWYTENEVIEFDGPIAPTGAAKHWTLVVKRTYDDGVIGRELIFGSSEQKIVEKMAELLKEHNNG